MLSLELLVMMPVESMPEVHTFILVSASMDNTADIILTGAASR